MEITTNVQETPVKTPQKVIVIGGSIAGLLTARVLVQEGRSPKAEGRRL
ncbi:MAG: hypothetical protein RIE73_26430 [Coleofasciculus sp. C1-SOL-03]